MIFLYAITLRIVVDQAVNGAGSNQAERREFGHTLESAYR
jgi:hypothetical protein